MFLSNFFWSEIKQSFLFIHFSKDFLKQYLAYTELNIQRCYFLWLLSKTQFIHLTWTSLGWSAELQGIYEEAVEEKEVRGLFLLCVCVSLL